LATPAKYRFFGNYYSQFLQRGRTDSNEERCNSYDNSIRPSVCPSHLGIIVPRQMKRGSRGLQCEVEKTLWLPRPIIKSHQRKKWVWPWARGAPQNCWVPQNISAPAAASEFKFGAHLGFAEAHHKMKCRRKGGRGPGLGDLPKILWLKLGISNLVYRLGLPRPTIKPHPKENWAWPRVNEVPIYLGFLCNIFAMAAPFS